MPQTAASRYTRIAYIMVSLYPPPESLRVFATEQGRVPRRVPASAARPCLYASFAEVGPTPPPQ